MGLVQGKPGDVSRGFGELERVSWGWGGGGAEGRETGEPEGRPPLTDGGSLLSGGE
jgi:hypothetical protein